MNFNKDMKDMIGLVKKDGKYRIRIWAALDTVIVLGRANKPEIEVFVSRAKKDNIKILRRLGGGGAVVLTEGVLIISIAKFVESDFGNQLYFNQINELIVQGLRDLNIDGLSKKGISDICINENKILGSSMYREQKLLFYQGSLLINPRMEIINKYLKHPSKEPAYRLKRKHEDFLTSLGKEGYKYSANEVEICLERKLNDYLCTIN
ncbi:MAG: hypothetical protein FD145_97 [Candidatus Saganbacteria bacterium]|uniref:BPL/LPL catalytic domain-containing protein n=1 Tax=Candidatus Saganbacteria bacterium TaxID=2575572 RepID=A0A833P3P3_UNCSA|nr:MAG: hypothetical protein FD145_97 [Candidatus Saganbacteria bacterium]